MVVFGGFFFGGGVVLKINIFKAIPFVAIHMYKLDAPVMVSRLSEIIIHDLLNFDLF